MNMGMPTQEELMAASLEYFSNVNAPPSGLMGSLYTTPEVDYMPSFLNSSYTREQMLAYYLRDYAPIAKGPGGKWYSQEYSMTKKGYTGEWVPAEQTHNPFQGAQDLNGVSTPMGTFDFDRYAGNYATRNNTIDKMNWWDKNIGAIWSIPFSIAATVVGGPIAGGAVSGAFNTAQDTDASFSDILVGGAKGAAIGAVTQGIGEYVNPAVADAVGSGLGETAGGFTLGEAIKAGASSSDLAALGFSQTAINTANIATGAVGNAIKSGVGTTVGGGNLGDIASSMGQGVVTGAVGGTTNALTGELSSQFQDATGVSDKVANAATNALVNTAASAAGAAVTGGDVANTALTNAATSITNDATKAGSQVLNNALVNDVGLSQDLTNIITPIITNTAGAALTGGDVLDAAKDSTVNSLKDNKDYLIGGAKDLAGTVGIDIPKIDTSWVPKIDTSWVPRINGGGIIPRINGGGIIPRISGGGGMPSTNTIPSAKDNFATKIKTPTTTIKPPVDYRAKFASQVRR